MSPGRASEDGEKESLVPIDIGIPFSDAEGGDHTQDRTTVYCSQKTIAHQRFVVRVLASSLVIIILANALFLYKAMYPGLNVRRRPLVEQFPLVPADFPQDKRWMVESGADPFRTIWWPNEDHGFAHNGINITVLDPGQEPWQLTKDSEENIWAKYGNPYIMLHKKDPLWLPHGVDLKQRGPQDAWMSDYNGFLTVHGHAMHCVGVLRHHLTRATESREEQDPVEMEHANGHCIEVIRRALECTPNLYMTGVIDSNFWDARTSNNPLMCRAGVTEWLSKRWIPRDVVWMPLSADTREGTTFLEDTNIRDFDVVDKVDKGM